MARSWVAKLSKGFLLKELGIHRQPRHGEFGNQNSPSSMLLRSFSTEVSASEQMNLIRQLRERTSAPIKDVKAALVGSNWDIGEMPFTFWTAVNVLGSCVAACCTLVDSCRGCTEGPEKKRSGACIKEVITDCC